MPWLKSYHFMTLQEKTDQEKAEQMKETFSAPKNSCVFFKWKKAIEKKRSARQEIKSPKRNGPKNGSVEFPFSAKCSSRRSMEL